MFDVDASGARVTLFSICSLYQHRVSDLQIFNLKLLWLVTDWTINRLHITGPDEGESRQRLPA
jgi:hypothetical protein